MILFSTGPANISDRVRKAMTKPDICHRDTEFIRILKNSRMLISDILNLGDSYESIILSGSGSAAIEGVISSFGGCGKKILIISNGVYGERAAEMAILYDINFEKIKLKWGELPDLKYVESRLRKDDFCAVYMVHHETTTGLINPLMEIIGIARRYNRLVLTDAISSIAGEVLDIDGWGIDAVICSANKCIRGVPGISFVISSSRFLKTIDKYKSRSFYNNLLLYRKYELENQTPFTPPVQVYYAFEEALKELKEETVDKRIKKYKKVTGLLRRSLKNMGIKFLLPEAQMSNTMTALHVPTGQTYISLHRELKKKGFVIYPSHNTMPKETFRLGTVGIISEKDIKRFVSVLKELI